MALDSMKEIFDQMERENIPFWEVVLQADMEERQVTRKQSMAKMSSLGRRWRTQQTHIPARERASAALWAAMALKCANTPCAAPPCPAVMYAML